MKSYGVLCLRVNSKQIGAIMDNNEKLEFVIERLQDKEVYLQARVKTGLTERTMENVLKRRHKPNQSTLTALYSFFTRKK